jgi:hypothetical protein
MKQLLLSLFAFCCIILATAQDNVSNTDFTFNEDTTECIIVYDLESVGHFHFFDISITAKLNGRKIPCNSITGDVGSNIRSGDGKMIIWDFSKDVSYIDGDLTFIVKAINNVPDIAGGGDDQPKTNKKYTADVPVTAGLLPIAAAGFGLIVAGAVKEGNAQDQYAIYTDNLDENADVYIDMDQSRDDVYKEANKSHIIAQGMLWAGVGIIVADGFILVRRVIQRKKGADTSNITPRFGYDINPYALNPTSNIRVGLTIDF